MSDRGDFLSKIKAIDSRLDLNEIARAYDVAEQFHSGQTRTSGEPYIVHPMAVAEICAKMHLDTCSVVTALLHDTVEDTSITIEEIDKIFGQEVKNLVEGVTKLAKIDFKSDNLKQAENFRKLLLAMSNDIRVLLVKLADRLHNIRTIDYLPSHKQLRIALETKEIYAPLAERIGMQQIKLELHDTSFRVLHPEMRESILKRLSKIAIDGQDITALIISDLEELILIKNEMKAQIHGRQKTPYSIWQKMLQKNVSFEQLSDVIAFRIIVKNKEDCYKALGLIHTHYKMVPGNFIDFISIPKNNGYSSIHTVIIGPSNQKIEVQIRTTEMHDVAEHGVAAHWLYKQHYLGSDSSQLKWINELLSILEQAGDPEEFLHNTKLAMYYDQVFCFTPKGEIVALPKGATAIDFAYSLHTDIGHKCVSTKINGRIVPINTTLNNGDQIEIFTDKSAKPSPSWEKFVVTGKAIADVKKFIKTQQKKEYLKLGKALFKRYNSNNKILLDEENCKTITKFFNKPTLDDVFRMIGRDELQPEAIGQALESENASVEPKGQLFHKIKTKYNSLKKKVTNHSNNDHSLVIKGLTPGVAVNFATCCYPILGDNIVGIMHSGKGITVHKIDCETLNNYTEQTNKVIGLSWEKDEKLKKYIGRLSATLANEPGSLAVVTYEIAKLKGNITYLKIDKRNEQFFDLIFDIEVAGTGHLNNIIQILQSKTGIITVKRYAGQ